MKPSCWDSALDTSKLHPSHQSVTRRVSRPCEKCRLGLYLKFEACLGVLPVLLLNPTPQGQELPTSIRALQGRGYLGGRPQRVLDLELAAQLHSRTAHVLHFQKALLRVHHRVVPTSGKTVQSARAPLPRAGLEQPWRRASAEGLADPFQPRARFCTF